MDIWQRTSCNCDGAGLFDSPLFAVRFAADIDMQGFDVIGPVAAGDLSIGLDALCILGLGVGVVA